jgi:hypothetical protein
MSSNPPPVNEALREQTIGDTRPRHASPSSPIPAAVISAEQLKAARKVLERHAGRHTSASTQTQTTVSP